MPQIALNHEHPSLLHFFRQFLPDWVSEASVNTFFLIAMLGLVTFIGSRALRNRDISKRQSFWESVVFAFTSFVEGLMGPQGRNYVPFIGTLFLFILSMNMLGVVPGFISPTASLNTTIALALSVFLYVQFQAIRVTGVGHYLKHLAGEPLLLAPLMLPLHIIGELAKPMSLALRLAGNVFAEDSVLLILGALSPVLFLFFKAEWAKEVPFFPLQALLLPLMIFFGLIQALVFSTLSAIYISLMLGEGAAEHGTH
jgi:F-type H+-transporting ATPase subunit a